MVILPSCSEFEIRVLECRDFRIENVTLKLATSIMVKHFEETKLDLPWMIYFNGT